jgi:hypothetical protein
MNTNLLPTEELLLLKKTIECELRQRYNITMIPFDIIVDKIFSYLDWNTRISFMYSTYRYYNSESTFLLQLQCNFMLGSIYMSINEYSTYMFTTCRCPSVYHIFLHWTPFSRFNHEPVATLCWSYDYPQSQLHYNHSTLEAHAFELVRKNILQGRLCVHSESKYFCNDTICRNFYFKTNFIQAGPVCVFTADPYRVNVERTCVTLSTHSFTKNHTHTEINNIVGCQNKRNFFDIIDPRN